MYCLFVPSCSSDLSKFHLHDVEVGCNGLQTLSVIACEAEKIFVPRKKYRSHSWDSQVSDMVSCSDVGVDGSNQNVPSLREQWKYNCSICSKSFERPSTLKTHMNSHTGERPFSCPNKGCGRSFTVRSNMMRHYKKCLAN